MNKIRVLHVCYHMNRAGIETWLMHVLRHTDFSAFAPTVMVTREGPNDFDSDLKRLGVPVIACHRPTELWWHVPQFLNAIDTHGPFDIIHSHITSSGIVLREARWLGIPVRIAHSHNGAPYFRPKGWLGAKSLFVAATNRWLGTDATMGLACSREAAHGLYGLGWERHQRRRILYYGIDVSPFAEQHDRAGIRTGLGLPADAPVVGHIGRFFPQKNHEFLVRIIAAAVRRRPDIRFLLVGDGPLRPAITDAVRQAGIEGAVVFAGVRGDVPRLLGAMDAFVFPSHYEGLPVTLIETQTAGLPAVISSAITREVDYLPALVHRLHLTQSPEVWADAVVATATSPRPLTPDEALGHIRESPFTIENSVRSLESLYREQFAMYVSRTRR